MLIGVDLAEMEVALLNRVQSVMKGGGSLSLNQTSQLVARTRAGDTQAFDALVTEYRGPLFQIIQSLMRDPEDVMETLQEAFVQAYDKLHKFDNRKPFFPWVARIALNCCYELLRKNGHRATAWSSLPQNATGQEEGKSLEDSVADPRPGPEREYEIRETHDLVLDMVHRLPTRDRLVIILRCINLYSCQEVGDLLGMSPEQVKKRLYASRRWLERQLQDVLESRVWTEP